MKLYNVQIVRGEKYEEIAKNRYYNPDTKLFDRCIIYFSAKDGNLVPAAVTKSGHSLAITPNKIVGLDAAKDLYSKINSVLSIDEKLFMSKAVKSNDPYEELAKRLDGTNIGKLKKMNLPNVVISEDRWRYYPGTKIASNVIGFVGYKGDVLEGRYGLERFYEDTLKKEEKNNFTNFFAETFLNINNALSGKAQQGDIVATIEPTVEQYLETAVEKINSKWRSKKSGGIIMDPNTGEIFAMAAFPNFDPNKYQNENDMSVFANSLVESVYEMGSIIKPLTMAAGLDSGVVTTSTTYDDKGFLEFNGMRIENFDGKGRGVVDMQTVLSKSLNTGAAFVALKMGNTKFAEYMRNYGLGEKTGIDLPNEVAGLISNLNGNIDIEHVTASYGHGIAMSPVATVRALASLANGGTLVTPHLVKKIIYDSGISKDITYPLGRRVIKKETSEEISRMLVKVVDEAMLNGKAKNSNYSVAAKTGTAELTKPEGGYYDNRFLHSFFGYFPAYSPRFIVFLFTYDPQNVTYASETLTASFLDISKFLINYYEIPPDR